MKIVNRTKYLNDISCGKFKAKSLRKSKTLFRYREFSPQKGLFNRLRRDKKVI